MDATRFVPSSSDLERMEITPGALRRFLEERTGNDAGPLLVSILKNRVRSNTRYQTTAFSYNLSGVANVEGPIGYQQIVPANPDRKSLIIAIRESPNANPGDGTQGFGLLLEETAPQFVSTASGVPGPQPPQTIANIVAMLNRCVLAANNLHATANQGNIYQIVPAPTQAITVVLNVQSYGAVFPILSGVILEGS